jgi:phage tail-like protein
MARVDPYKNFRFLVELDGIVQAGFTDCSGFGSEMEVVEYREGGDPDHVHKLRAKAVFPNITLKWGVTDSHELYDWHQAALKGDLQDDTGQEKVRWNFFDAWPSKWEGSALTAKGNDAAIETLTVSCERLERAK